MYGNNNQYYGIADTSSLLRILSLQRTSWMHWATNLNSSVCQQSEESKYVNYSIRTSCSFRSSKKVSMGLTVSCKRPKIYSLDVKIEKFKPLVVKQVNHKKICTQYLPISKYLDLLRLVTFLVSWLMLLRRVHILPWYDPVLKPKVWSLPCPAFCRASCSILFQLYSDFSSFFIQCVSWAV